MPAGTSFVELFPATRFVTAAPPPFCLGTCFYWVCRAPLFGWESVQSTPARKGEAEQVGIRGEKGAGVTFTMSGKFQIALNAAATAARPIFLITAHSDESGDCASPLRYFALLFVSSRRNKIADGAQLSVRRKRKK
jgi:hypothetical protein